MFANDTVKVLIFEQPLNELLLTEVRLLGRVILVSLEQL